VAVDKAGHRRLEMFSREVNDCSRCSLGAGGKIVFGEGDPDAELVLVGEAPGAQEELQGRPFVGAAGRMLMRMLASIDLERGQVYICNVLKCRPPKNRKPTPAEVLACKPLLERQLDLLKPKLICALGTFAAQALLDTREPIGKLRGRIFTYRGVSVMPTLHPAALLYQPLNKQKVWEDLQTMAELLGGRRANPKPFLGK